MDELKPSPNLFVRAKATTDQLQRELPKELRHPKIAIICGSGLGGLADSINAQPRVEIGYAQTLNFPVSTGRFTTRAWTPEIRK